MSTQSLSHLTEQSTPPHTSTDVHASHVHRAGGYTGLRLPDTRLGRVERLLRLETALVLTLPTLCGSAIAWWEQGQMDVTLLILHLLVILCGIIGIHVLGEANDYRYTLRPESKYLSDKAIAGSNLVAATWISLRSTVLLGAALVVGALLGALWLMSLVGWPVFFFTLLMLVIYSAYAVPPTCHGYLSWGIGEVGIFLGFGLLSVLSGYYTQAHNLTALALWTSVPLGLFCVLVLHAQNFIYQRRDWMLRKRTLAVALRDRRALNLGVLLTLVAYTSLLLLVVIMMLPPWVLISMLALPPTLKALTNVRDKHLSIHSRQILYRTMSRAALCVCLTIAIVLYLN